MRIAVAMSGGVDSSVAALALRDCGHEVFGVTMRLYDSPASDVATPHRCCGATDIADARAVAFELGIPHYVADMAEAFEERVIGPFVAGYAAGTTPIPCLACNQDLKFHRLLSRATGMGADLLATGHYARIAREDGAGRLLRGRDRERDQSYYLYMLGQPELSRLVFPLGDLSKDEVRARARAAGLSVHDKPDSQEICFVPIGSYADFVERRAAFAGGPIKDRDGRTIGEHEGIHRYTVGQRRGLGASSAGPRYVLAIDAATNTVVAGPERDLHEDRCRVAPVSWVERRPVGSVRAQVKVRARHAGSPATVTPDVDGPGATVRFDAPERAIAPGQAAVFYDGERVLGGGIIARPAPIESTGAAAGSP